MDFRHDVIAISGSKAVSAVLHELCALTDMGFAAVARVTEQRWIACQVLDRIAFGLEPGNELKVKTTICDEIRKSGTAVYIDDVQDAPMWRTHPTPILYGFRSYVSVPIHRGGVFFGTLCAIDPDAHVVDTDEMRAAIELLAERVSAVLDTETGRGVVTV